MHQVHQVGAFAQAVGVWAAAWAVASRPRKASTSCQKINHPQTKAISQYPPATKMIKVIEVTIHQNYLINIKI